MEMYQIRFGQHSTIIRGISLIHILFCFLLHFANSQIPSPSSSAKFNQLCLTSSQCNNVVGLYCIRSGNGPLSQLRCGCPTNGTTYDERKGRCVGKLGYPCIYHENGSHCPDNAHCSHQDPHHPDLYYYEQRCFCDLDYFGTKVGQCTLAAKYAESCSILNKKCDDVSGLKCTDGKCLCEFGDEQYYDLKKRKCVSYVGKNCSEYYGCVDNGRCDGISPTRTRTLGSTGTGASIDKKEAIGGSRGNTKVIGGNGIIISSSANSDAKNLVAGDNSVGKCICEYGFTPTIDGKCLGGHRQSCTQINRCNQEDDLECQDGSCTCKSPLHQHYDHLKKKCVSLVGAPCSSYYPSSTSQTLCTENAECSASDGFCKCKPGFSKTPFRKCLLDYLEPCENGQCNLYNGLTCKSANKKCSCLDDSLVYNRESQACVSLLNSPCGKIGQAGDYGKEAFYISCEPSALCKQEPGGDSTTQFCRPRGDSS